MSHIEQRNFCQSVKEKYPDFFKNKKVLDIGSLDINGSNRDFFENCDYTGIDVGKGKNVDVVSVGHLFEGEDNYYDTIISTEVFEHDMFYEKTVTNIMRMLKPGGLFLFTCAAPGRPEHGTRRNGEFCAPLLLQISEEWADYYKNLIPDDFNKITNFVETFPNCYFEIKDTDIEIPSDLYFHGIKGGDKTITINSNVKYNQFNDDVFIIDCWLDTVEKENQLIKLIERVKTYGVPIILCGHYPIKPEIQKLVDYFIYDSNNDILLEKDFEKYKINSDRWTKINNYTIINKIDFHHDYAIWLTMKNAFNLANQLNKKYIHFIEYDNLPDEIQYRQSFMETIRNHDAVIYEYSEGSTKEDNPYCATYIFSIKTDIALNLNNKIKSKDEFFDNKPNRWQLEKNFYQTLKTITENIGITKYISNNDEFNIFAAWNRDGVLRNNAKFQTYLGVDGNNKLYIHFISGFSNKPADKDYLIEVTYNNETKFIELKKGQYNLTQLGDYVRFKTVKVYYRGMEVFSEYLKENVVEFNRKNKVIKNSNTNKTINVNFIDGPYIEIVEDDSNNYLVEFINGKNNKIEYSLNLKSNHWAKCGIKYKIDWIIKVRGIDNEFNYEHVFNPKGRRILIGFESKSLGDNIAWIPYVEKFRKDNDCEVVCSTFHNYLFEKQYPEIKFIKPGDSANNLYGLFRLGMFYNENKQIDYSKHPTDPKKEPLLKIASDILGLDYMEIKPKLPKLGKTKQKRVCIAIHSTAQAKYWNNPNGWQDVVNFLKEKGYEVTLLSKEEDGYMGNPNPKGVTKLPEGPITNVVKVLQESELFIGISSGLSWLAWGCGTPTVLISGFTDVFLEPFDGITRIINKDVCNGCWSTHDFDPADWNWCPIQKGTDKQFECSKSITSKQVINKISGLLP